MMPTFHPGNLLYVRPDIQDLTPGDVIVFSDLLHSGWVVHRVIVVTPVDLVTRGDHNLQRDGLPVAYGEVVGRVEAVDCDGVIKNVIGGRPGLWIAKVRWAVLGLWTRLRYFIGAPYRALKNSPQFRGWLKLVIRLRLDYITLQTLHGPVVKAMHHGCVVARWKPELSRFECRKPYDLWLEQSDLSLVENDRKS